MPTVWVTMEPCDDKPGWYAPTGFHLTEPSKWCYSYEVNDPEEFIKHMRRYHNAQGAGLSRQDYEALCAEFKIVPLSDDKLDTYEMHYGDFGMSHYHTKPENREIGIAQTIHQRRYCALKAGQEAKVIQHPDIKCSHAWGTYGVRYDEACDVCGQIGKADNITGCCTVHHV